MHRLNQRKWRQCSFMNLRHSFCKTNYDGYRQHPINLIKVFFTSTKGVNPIDNTLGIDIIPSIRIFSAFISIEEICVEATTWCNGEA